MEAHGGYLCRLEGFGTADLVSVARAALLEDGQDPSCAGLQISPLGIGKRARLAYDSPHAYGRKGALWYGAHHALARRLSVLVTTTVHAYVYDPEELEQVVTFGAGRHVGGDRLRYDDADGLDDDVSEEDFVRLQERWPLGHLAQLLGVKRDELLRLPRAKCLLLDLAEGAANPPLDEAWSWSTAVVRASGPLRRRAL